MGAACTAEDARRRLDSGALIAEDRPGVFDEATVAAMPALGSKGAAGFGGSPLPLAFNPASCCARTGRMLSTDGLEGFDVAPMPLVSTASPISSPSVHFAASEASPCADDGSACSPDAAATTGGRRTTGGADGIDQAEWNAMLDSASNLFGMDLRAPAAARLSQDGIYNEGMAESNEMDPYVDEVTKFGTWDAAAYATMADGDPPDPDGSEYEEEPDFTYMPDYERLEILQRVRDEGQPLYSVPEHLRCDKEVVLAAISNEGAYCIDYITSKDLRERDRDVVLALCLCDGGLLKDVASELRADKIVVRAALTNCAEALQWASPELQADKTMKNQAENRSKEESRLHKAFQAKCGPAIQSCTGSRFSLFGSNGKSVF
eukprot:TRINITY_DN81216_c0_g1_i1.p1 TRINITY_DN81216_c0_g1~~TRINITY_DN81216_c0_g1_i1.p1  ORF type:complete len:376 (-),score=105.61 TRINITY_DN81216_c0_g1_i1:138-1265(-)